jgi:hypothetical protein
MKSYLRWNRVGVLVSVVALVALVAALAPGAQASSGFESCANKTVKFDVEGRKISVTAKAIAVEGTTCAAAYEFLKLVYSGEKISSTGYPQNYKCKNVEFKVPVGYVPTLCTKPGKKIKYGGQGG